MLLNGAIGAGSPHPHSQSFITPIFSTEGDRATIDLSNNNGAIDFKLLHRLGQRRAYLKLTEAVHFNDGKFKGFRRDAHRAGFKVGAYHFAQPHLNSPEAEAKHFLAQLPPLVKGSDLKPTLDLEAGSGDRHVGQWAERFSAIVYQRRGVRPIVYSYASYLESCGFPTSFIRSHWFWIAAYGRNDGREHPYYIPRALKDRVAAHQFSSRARLAGHDFAIDISHVSKAAALELPVRRSRPGRR